MSVLASLLVGAVLLILYLIYKYAYAPFQLLKQYGIKGPPPTPFLGHYKDRVKTSALEFDQKQVEKYGSVSGYYVGQQAYIMITDLDILKQILVKDFDNFSDHTPFPNIITDHEACDLFSSKGAAWRTARRTLSPSFSASKMKMMLPLIQRSADNLVVAVGEKATSEESFEVLKVFGCFTLESILATAFGRRVELQKGESDEFTKAMNHLVASFGNGEVEQFMLVSSHFPRLVTLFNPLFAYTEGGKALKYVMKTAKDLIKIRRETGQTGKFKDLLQLMIEASGEEGDSDEEKETTDPPAECPADKPVPTIKIAKGVMTDEEVIDNAFGFLSAGNETSAVTLSFASYELAVNPDIQEKLQSEIDAYFEDNPEANLYKAAQEIDYLDKVIQETLRLHPPAPETDRYCNKKTTVNGVTIPKGAVVIVPIQLLQYSPLYWTDPEKFDPERFTAEEKAKRPQLSHIPFGFGPRSCIGMRLALLQIKVALIEVLKKYTFIRAPETEVPLIHGVGSVIWPKNGIYIRVTTRS